MGLLETLKLPEGLKTLSKSELEEVSEEVAERWWRLFPGQAGIFLQA